MRTYEVYSSGDQVWFGERNGQETVTKVVTHDGLVWSEEEPALTRLTGMELYIHKAQVALTRLILKVLRA